MNTNSQTLSPVALHDAAQHEAAHRDAAEHDGTQHEGTEHIDRRTALSALWWAVTMGLVVAFVIWWGRADLLDGWSESWASLARIGATVALIGLSAALNPWKAEPCGTCGHSR
ncbi:hypothetical protein [Ornithinimicrobium panacihumi]|uniref:hypothetical protein n=1 Tax=Ornithinimicrobium panacihumi TaxID=2008449 RepID=UPI003F8C0DBC